MIVSQNKSLSLVILLGVIVLQLGCQVALLFEAMVPFRLIFRTLTFATMLAALVLIPGRGKRHPCELYAVLVLGILTLNIFHPTTNTMLAGLAQTTLYLAILAPIFWVPRLAITPEVFQRYLMALWLWYSLSAAVGVLQVYYPGKFQPALSSAVRGMGEISEGLKITLADGTQMWRPMGLTDSPGGAGVAGLYAFLLGMGFAVNATQVLMRWSGIASMLMGLFCIYLSQTRSVFVMTLVASVSFAALLVLTGRYTRAARLYVAVPAVLVGSFLWAVAMGGEQVSKRFESLIAEDSSTVYYKSRGIFLEHTLEVLLPEYPLGAGLGRWGMMRGYFGDLDNPNSPGIWVEIQWTGWLLDGGIPLIVAYTLAIGIALFTALKFAFNIRDPWLATWAALIVAYNLSAIAVTFNYPLFIGQGGMEFWMLNAVLFAVVSRHTMSITKRS